MKGVNLLPFGLSEVEAFHRAKRDVFTSAQGCPSTSLRANGVATGALA